MGKHKHASGSGELEVYVKARRCDVALPMGHSPMPRNEDVMAITVRPQDAAKKSDDYLCDKEGTDMAMPPVAIKSGEDFESSVRTPGKECDNAALFFICRTDLFPIDA